MAWGKVQAKRWLLVRMPWRVPLTKKGSRLKILMLVGTKVMPSSYRLEPHSRPSAAACGIRD